MNRDRAIELIKKQIDISDSLKHKEKFSSDFKKWKRDTEIIIEKIFGDSSRHLSDFKKISYSLSFFTNTTPDYRFHEAYIEGIDEGKTVLTSMVDEINEFGIENESIDYNPNTLAIIENICNKFHLVARQLRYRHANRETLEIEDEYDVQDLFHSLLHLYFDDIRAEEWTPSYAGGSSRVDFLLKDEQIIIEIKKTRKNLNAKEIGDQLIIDSKRYKSHPDCKCLICFVYDPEGRIGNPVGLQNDLTEETELFKLITIIAPKGK
ncbi:PD-(D/E)XK nuclease domain-containing protein [Riemerella anatipestifer]|uniref:Uncharacterized protein n=2 Tax=Riemerella anatipestifer TaxID=34085 RepID=A0A1S7DPJ4_RIEAN|nr:hypothetical protein [Riemerella anatipestifer]AQY21047.1 hypothetical protein AB406_0082 [Riemerella anatipestifer]MCQ4040406.1 hypothetical protein [Riemerella anatipestifer]MCT6766054.1 hypothetical protein [Riemerella anatipestifer]MCT6770232.1 hypothetical protein [Riemerella anatipestifer]MCT6774341.1 hypothetical protein [Riemerella anatipestifer]